MAEATAELPFVSVIVPVRNEAAHIGRTLEQLLRQRYDSGRFEIIVADGRSTDETAAIVRDWAARHTQVVLVDNPQRWSSAGRNAAIRRARGDIVVIVDGHCQIDDEAYLARLVAAFQESGAAAVGRPQPLDVSGATPLQRAIAAARSSWLGHQAGSYVYCSTPQFAPAASVATAYRREVFRQIGYFDESFDACEDVEFNHRFDRAGLRCFFTPSAAVRYHPRTSLAGLWRQMVRYGRGRVRLLARHPDTMRPSVFAPGLFLVGCVAGLGLAWWSSWLMAVYLAVLTAYAAAVLGTSAAVAVARREYRLAFWMPAAFVAIHAGAGAGLVQECIVMAAAPLQGRRRTAVAPQADPHVAQP